MSGNPFVDYLNSLHNGNAANQNAIGEMQISSPFFAATQVFRPLVELIKAKVLDGSFVILTGHAGDGKTTLLSQVLSALGSPQQILQPSADVTCGTQKVHYVKDFSELTQTQQDDELKAGFHRTCASVLIANTGPLLAAFSRLDDKDRESELLDIMDQPTGGEIRIEGMGQAFLLNIARVDNTDFIRPFLKNLTKPSNWTSCHSCPCANKCPKYFNQRIISECFDGTAGFVEKVYIWLQEYDHRVTIRQITAHLTFSITGGLNCATVEKHCASSWLYRYLFSNLFFGCEGIRTLPNALQIRGIALVKEARFDQKQTCMDYSLFNKTDYTPYFPAILAKLFEEVFGQHRHSDPNLAQMVIKRAYLFFGLPGSSMQDLMKDVFSEWYDMYLRIRNNGEKPREAVKRDICSAIHALFVGETLENGNSEIDLTLRRNNEQTSNVQLLSGFIPTSNISLECEPVKTIDGTHQYRLVLKTDKVRYPISLPLLNYFNEIHHGVIMTDIDPMLSNGIDSLKAELLFHHAASLDANVVYLVFLSGSRWVRRRLLIDPHSIDHE